MATRLRQRKSETSVTYDCPICMTTNTRELLQLPCGHNLCLKCLHMICAHSTLACPYCRRRLSTWLRHNPDYSKLIIRKRGRGRPRKYPKEEIFETESKPKQSKRTYRTSKTKPTVKTETNIDADWLLAKQIHDQEIEEFRYYYGRITRSMSKKVSDFF